MLKAKAEKKTIFKKGYWIKYWINRGGIKSDAVEVEINTSKLEDKEFFKLMVVFLRDIDENGGVAWRFNEEFILAEFNIKVFKFYLNVINNY